ncbi:MAG: hypothetical protein ACRD3W_09760, partial [Terriglobales bacterium]
MVQDLSNQKKASRELILAAIEALKAKGYDINPYTVADEAGIQRSQLYRNTEYMEMIARERQDAYSAADADGLKQRLSELEARNRDLEEEIWNLEAKAEQFGREREEAYRRGVQHGHEEAVRNLKSGATSSSVENMAIRASTQGLVVISPQSESLLGSTTQPMPATDIEPAQVNFSAAPPQASTAPPEPPPKPEPEPFNFNAGPEPRVPDKHTETGDFPIDEPEDPPELSEGGPLYAGRGYQPLPDESLQLFAGIDNPAQVPGASGTGDHAVLD